MALTIGDGPNRGKSAPPPGRSTPPKQSASAQRLSREFTQRIAERNDRTQGWNPLWLAQRPELIEPRTEAHFQVVPALTAVAPRVAEAIGGKKSDDFNLFQQANPLAVAIQGLPKPADTTLQDRKFFLDMDQQMTRDATGTDPSGNPASTFRGTFEDPEVQKGKDAQMQAVADMYNVRARLGRRDQARMDREKVDRKETEKALTPEQWNKLTPMQQAAVQANADLMAAVARDFKDQGHHGNDWQKGGSARIKDYQDQVAKIFGEGELDAGTGYKGLEYAPNTIAFLDKRGIDHNDLAGKTLDDLVSGDALIDEDVIYNLAKPTANDARARNVTFAKNLAAGQLRYQENLAAQLKRGDQLLNDLTGRDTSRAATGAYGAKAISDEAKFPAIRPDTQRLLSTYMEFLARKDSDPAEALAAIHGDLEERGASAKEREQVTQALIQQTRDASVGSPWFDGVDFPMRTPIEVARVLGGVTLKREGAK